MGVKFPHNPIHISTGYGGEHDPTITESDYTDQELPRKETEA